MSGEAVDRTVLQAGEHKHRTRGDPRSESSEDRVNRLLRDQGDDVDVEQLGAVMRTVPAADFFQWKSPSMPKVLIAMDFPLESYEKNTCIEAMLHLFHGTPVLQLPPQLTPLSDSAVPSQNQLQGLALEAGLRSPVASGGPRAATEGGPSAPQITVADLKSLMREQMGEFKEEVEALRSEFRSQMKNSKGADPASSRAAAAAKVVPGAGWNANVPKVTDLFAAVEHATRNRFGEDGDSADDGDDAHVDVSARHSWVFDTPSFPGGPHVARKVYAEKPRRHARKGGEEDLYQESKEKL
jgi:hypothetical protein